VAGSRSELDGAYSAGRKSPCSTREGANSSRFLAARRRLGVLMPFTPDDPEGHLRVPALPVSYFVQQLADFKSGARKMSGPERPSTQLMMASAKGMTNIEVLAAAEYFAALKPKRIIKVVESETIPKTGPSRLFYMKSPEGGTEPLVRPAHRRDARQRRSVRAS
jgi:hypothetical protein